MKIGISCFYILTLFFIAFPSYAGNCVDENGDSTRRALNCIEEKIDKTVEKTKGIGKKGSAVNKTSSRTWATCPGGYYVSGIKGVDQDGGDYCSTCISTIEIQCSPL